MSVLLERLNQDGEPKRVSCHLDRFGENGRLASTCANMVAVG